MRRRKIIVGAAVVMTTGIAGCSGGGTSDENGSPEPDEDEGTDSGATQEPMFEGATSDRVQHNVEASPGDIIRVEADNQEGPVTTVTILDPEEEILLQEKIETQSTLTTTAETEGVFSVLVNSTGTTEYEIYLDSN